MERRAVRLDAADSPTTVNESQLQTHKVICKSESSPQPEGPARRDASFLQVVANGDNEKSPNRGALPASRQRILEVIATLLYVGLYLAVGPLLILVNQYILKTLRFSYPMALSGLGLMCSSAIAVFMRLFGLISLDSAHVVTPAFMMYNLMPIGFSSAATLAAGNAVYMYLPVGFIQMLKAFTPAVTLVFLGLSGLERPTRKVVFSVLVICAGTAIASFGEGSMNPAGLLLMFSAEAAEGLKLVLTQKLLQRLKFGVIESQYFMAPISAVWLFSASAFNELPSAYEANAISIVLENPGIFFLAACLGFCVHIVSSLVIRATNSVTLKVLGTARNAGLVLFSALFLDEMITPMEWTGYSVSLVGFAAYNIYSAKA
eukprot:TRINITY_DN56997_c0_g1_i1.p1 TRINITY_DN56997_c0_g1~~TRINITY_DN56997_c0_g1_i1.p1  ORF type:complete len:374 (+),score=61.10 TRINITY_DN56997_c0_g1_i1:71-1192(+)